AEELRKAGYLDEGDKRFDAAYKQAIDTGMEIHRTDNQLKVARIYKDPTGIDALILEQAKIIANNPVGSEAYNQAKDRLNILDKNRAIAQEKLSFNQKLDKARTYRQQIKGLQDRLAKPVGLSAEKKKEMEDRIEQLKQEAFSLYDIDPRDLEESGRNVYGTTLENPLAPQQNVLMQQRGTTAGSVNTPRLSDPLGIR
ncbi:hypothetical protein EBZ39_06300, partial [bacterium]|nr:hypothetical protein [bacterium]